MADGPLMYHIFGVAGSVLNKDSLHKHYQRTHQLHTYDNYIICQIKPTSSPKSFGTPPFGKCLLILLFLLSGFV